MGSLPTVIQVTLGDLKMVDAEAVKKICDIYDWDGKGELDLFFLGDVMYALGMNTTKKVCVGLGQTDEEGKKFAKFDEIVEKVNAAKNTPDSSGTYHDYVELLKLYDKNILKLGLHNSIVQRFIVQRRAIFNSLSP